MKTIDGGTVIGTVKIKKRGFLKVKYGNKTRYVDPKSVSVVENFTQLRGKIKRRVVK